MRVASVCSTDGRLEEQRAIWLPDENASHVTTRGALHSVIV
jgi:hypothetical protein